MYALIKTRPHGFVEEVVSDNSISSLKSHIPEDIRQDIPQVAGVILEALDDYYTYTIIEVEDQ